MLPCLRDTTNKQHIVPSKQERQPHVNYTSNPSTTPALSTQHNLDQRLVICWWSIELWIWCLLYFCFCWKHNCHEVQDHLFIRVPSTSNAAGRVSLFGVPPDLAEFHFTGPYRKSAPHFGGERYKWYLILIVEKIVLITPAYYRPQERASASAVFEL